MTAPVKISAIICTYNRYDLLGSAIDSCLAQSMDQGDFDVIVVDNSPDAAGAKAFAAKYADQTALSYVHETTPGLSNARNVGAAHSKAEIVAFLDDDAIAKPDWLAALVAAYDSFGPSTSVAGGKISPIWDQPRPSWLADDKLGYVSVVDWGGKTRPLGPSEWIAGANISFRRKALLDAGGFDTNLGRNGPEVNLLSNEETAVLRSLSDAGGIALYVPEAEVDHLVDRRRLNQEWFRRRAAWQAVSDFLSNPDIGQWSGNAMDNSLDYLLKQPPRHRAISGLCCELDDSDDFNDQINAVYNMTVAMLAGLKSV
ncbi:MAG: glycosyltransferase family 2 protein [Sedimentitalea sp.]